MNIVDLIIVLILVYYALRGFHQGIITIVFELFGYIVAYIVSLKFSYLGAGVIAHYLPVQAPKSYENTAGVAIVWIVTIFVYYLIAPFVLRLIPPIISHSPLNKIGGVAGSLIKGLAVISVILFVLHIAPLPKNLQNDLNHSYLAPKLNAVTSNVAKKLGVNLDSSITSTINQITTIPESITSTTPTEKLVHLGYTVTSTTIVPDDELTMFNFVNEQRHAKHLPKLTLNNTLVQVARNYGTYMFNNGFFSHITPSGQSPFDRVKDTNLSFTYVGENIALAPDVNAADTGFMNSPEHKANILDPHYSQIGIGVVDGGDKGRMYVQDFIGNN